MDAPDFDVDVGAYRFRVGGDLGIKPDDARRFLGDFVERHGREIDQEVFDRALAHEFNDLFECGVDPIAKFAGSGRHDGSSKISRVSVAIRQSV